PLARVVRPVLHELLGRDVERHGHRGSPPPGPPARRMASISATTAPRVSSSTRWYPADVTVATTGQIRRVVSGPPVAASSSAASTRACTATRTASCADMSDHQSFFSEPFAYAEPEPTAW